MSNYFCTDLEFFTPLYVCLAVNHNFDDYVKSTDTLKWQLWMQKLKHKITNAEQRDKLIKMIDRGELMPLMKNSLYPNIQHIHILLKSLSRDKMLDNKIDYGERVSDKSTIENIREKAAGLTPGTFADFDKEAFTKHGRAYFDKYIDKKV